MNKRRVRLFKRNKGKLRLSDILSNEMFQLTLEDLDWTHAESKEHAWEFIKLKELEDKSIFLAVILRTITNPMRFGDYVYHRRGADLMERESPLITKKRKDNRFFKVTKEVKKTLSKIVNDGPRGVIIK